MTMIIQVCNVDTERIHVVMAKQPEQLSHLAPRMFYLVSYRASA